MDGPTSPNGWTGGQYSVVRALAGAGLAVRFVLQALAAPEPLEVALQASGALWSVLFALGIWERASAYALAPTLIAAGFIGGERGPGQVHWLALAVLLHLATPAAPYLSFDARGRVDPSGGWRLPQSVRWVALLALAGSLLTWWLSRSQPLLAPLWYAALCCDPGWFAPKRASGAEWLFYDGSCGFCQRSVRFVLAEEAPGSPTFRFAPLFGEAFAREVMASDAASLPDSVVVRTDDGRLLVRSRAMLHVASRLGGGWRVAGALVGLVPAPLLDLGYDFMARIRTKLFPPPSEACPLLPPHLRGRFVH
ncbi:MAG: DUF393 domain-containing protein [Planctomycetaceae bacterium]|jgi:predicted DCC family thiol-disulfide oxidoreductase YuxK|nr:DUF393 domain-containing protein [Planctomycetaceae bacterium]